MMRKLGASTLETKKQFRMLPGHLVVGLWCLFTIGMLAWIVAASLSTSPEIMRGETLKFATGFHFENRAACFVGSYYKRILNARKVFLDSLFAACHEASLSVHVYDRNSNRQSLQNKRQSECGTTACIRFAFILCRTYRSISRTTARQPKSCFIHTVERL